MPAKRRKKREPTWDQIGNAIGRKMEKEFKGCDSKPWMIHKNANSNTTFIYVLGFIGAAAYYVSTATSLWTGILGVLKALVWPAFFVYGSLKALGI